MKEFDEAFLGRMANEVGAVVRNMKRRIRDLGPAAPVPQYSAEQSAAAQGVIAALAAVDQAFSDRRLSDPMSYCDCCTDPAFVERLASTPRDQISEEDMAGVAGSLLYTLGDTNDFRYFVPRFCSDSIGSPLYDVDAVFARFRRAGFDDWPDSQRSAVRRLLAAHWRFALLTEPRHDLSSMQDPWLVTLECIACLGDVEHALNAWESSYAASADARLLELLERVDVGESSISIVGVGGFDENRDAYTAIERWLRSASIRGRIDAALESLRATDGAMAERIDVVLAALARLPQG